MKINRFATAIAASLLMAGFVPASSAQDTANSAQEGIEVITIIGKRPAATVATGCVNAGNTHTAISALPQHGSNQEALGSDGVSAHNPGRAKKQCTEQTAAAVRAQI